MTHGDISLIPNFTAIMHGNKGVGHYNLCRFDAKTTKPINSHGLEPRTGVVELCEPTGNNNELPNGLASNSWIDFKGRHITTIAHKTLIDGVEFADLSENTFEPVPPMGPNIEL